MQTKQPSYDKLHQTYKHLAAKEETTNLQQFVILNDKAEQQILQINLASTGIAHIKAYKLYTNNSEMKVNKVVNPKFPFLSRIIKRNDDVYMLVNDTPALQIIGIKHPLKNGQILVLDLSVYGQSLYFNFQCLIASKKPPINLPVHPQLPSLKLAEHKDQIDNIFDALDITQQVLALQSESFIIQKCLAQQQEFCLFEKEDILALSKTMKIQAIKDGIVKLKGPGWVFFQVNTAQSVVKKRNNINFKVIIYFSLLTAFLQLVLATLL